MAASQTLQPPALQPPALLPTAAGPTRRKKMRTPSPSLLSVPRCRALSPAAPPPNISAPPSWWTAFSTTPPEPLSPARSTRAPSGRSPPTSTPCPRWMVRPTSPRISAPNMPSPIWGLWYGWSTSGSCSSPTPPQNLMPRLFRNCQRKGPAPVGRTLFISLPVFPKPALGSPAPAGAPPW